jgi:hypothetical protein
MRAYLTGNLLIRLLLMGMVVHLSLAQGAIQSYCPPFPGYDDTQAKQEGELSVSLLSKILDSFKLSGSNESTKTQVLQRYPNSSELLQKLVFFTSVCRSIENNPKLSASEKTDQLWGAAGKILGISSPSPDTPKPRGKGVLPPPTVADPAPPKTLEFNLGSVSPANFFDLDDVRLTVVDPGTAAARIVTYIGAIKPRCLPFGPHGRERAELYGYAKYANGPEKKFFLRQFGQTRNPHYKESGVGPTIGPDIPTAFRLDIEGRCDGDPIR